MAKPEEEFGSEYERGLLSLAFRNRETLLELRQKVTSDYFLDKTNKCLYNSLCSLSDNPTVVNIDIESWYIEAQKFGFKTSPEYIAIVAEGGFDTFNFEFYLEDVNDAYLKYSHLKTLENSYDYLLKNSKKNPIAIKAKEIVDYTISEINRFGGQTESGTASCTLGERIRDLVIERASAPTEVRGLRTGFPTLDKEINGLMNGGVTIIAGEAKSGKSTFLINVADYVAIQSKIDAIIAGLPDPSVPVLYISTEMYNDEDALRNLALRTLVAEREISNGTAWHDSKKKERLEEGISQMEEGAKIYHVFLPDFNPAKVGNLITYYKFKYNIGLAIFDYIKLDTVGDTLKVKREDQALGDLTNELKMVAGKLKIPILSACQINTRTKNVADSDRILRYCNNLLFFVPKTIEEMEQQQPIKQYGTHKLVIRNTRSGGHGWIPVSFWKSCVKLTEAERYPVEEEEQEDQNFILTTPDEWDRKISQRGHIETVTTLTSLFGTSNSEN